MNYGEGTAPGKSFVVFKSVRNGRYLSMNNGKQMKADRQHNFGSEKFKPTFLGNNLVAL